MNKSTQPGSVNSQLTERQFLLVKIALIAYLALGLFSAAMGFFKVAFGTGLAAYLVLGYRKFKKHKRAKAGSAA